MNKNKGFTLVELIAVIVILALILALVVPKVFKTIDESKKRSCNIQLEYIKDAAATYFARYRYNTVSVNSSLTYDDAAKQSNGVDIKLSNLVGASLLKGTITNPVNEKILNPDETVVNIKNTTVTGTTGIFEYTILIKNNETNEWDVVSCK